MDIFKRSTFLELSEVYQPHCVSIYIPTDRASGEEGRYKNRTRLKNQIKKASNILKGFGLSKQDAEAYLQPAHDLTEDSDFWSKQSDGLAIFIYAGQIQYFTLPLLPDEFTYVANHLYLQPLAGLLNGEDRHFILELSLGHTRFFEATRHTITPVITEGLIPEAIEEAVGMDYEEKSLQFRSGQGGQDEAALFHGHGSGSESEKKEEILKYFRNIDKGLMKMLHDETAPMVIACVDYLFPLYQGANSYKYLQADHISGNQEHTDLLKTKELAWNIVKGGFHQKLDDSRKRYDELLNDGKSAFNLEEIIPAAIIGQTETLFIKKNEQVWGTYLQDRNKVSIDDGHRVTNVDLLNKAAIETVKHGGSVYVMEAGEMPEKDSVANAIFRFKM